MKRAAMVFTILVVLLSFTVGSALAANGLLTLIEVRNDAGGGVILVFHVSGESRETNCALARSTCRVKTAITTSTAALFPTISFNAPPRRQWRERMWW